MKPAFYPGTGEVEENTSQDESIFPGGILNIPIAPGLMTGPNWRSQFNQFIFPRLMQFKPDFIMISAGFDAHCKDHIHHPGDTGVTEFEF